MLAAAPAAAHAAAPNVDKAAEEENGLLGIFGGKPKYVFLFIGDGMGTAQIQSARFYKGTVENNGAVTEGELSFTQFPEVGSVTTYDSTSFCPDSASTATSIATGHKTESGVINMCPWTRDVPYKTIAEKLHTQKGYKVGVISTCLLYTSPARCASALPGQRPRPLWWSIPPLPRRRRNPLCRNRKQNKKIGRAHV